MKQLLVVVDMQNDFVYGSLGSVQAVKIIPAVQALLEEKRREGAEIVFTQDTHGDDYLNTQEGRLLPVLHTLRFSDGWQVIPELDTSGAKLFEKGAFGSPALAEYARGGGFDVVTLCGVCTDICVISNAFLIKAFCPEAEIRVAASACAGTSLQAHQTALSAMRGCQIFICEEQR